jgi:hypothetical protein
MKAVRARRTAAKIHELRAHAARASTGSWTDLLPAGMNSKLDEVEADASAEAMATNASPHAALAAIFEAIVTAFGAAATVRFGSLDLVAHNRVEHLRHLAHLALSPRLSARPRGRRALFAAA